MSINTYKLIDVLKGTEGLGEDDALYLPPGLWEKETTSLAWDVNDVDDVDPDADPEAAKQLGMKYVIMIQDLDDIAKNLESQIDNPSDDDYLSAFIFYMENDAFIYNGT
ncbi:DUF7716 domain-containing protein [Cobetia amphilecti]|uniref:DUF7716 domain-containing protein n=1 Tax=Cobetia amphilecti TaxID=1055104 RepID=UPI001C09F919|nr:hypothetical protein [Cobetia amphilecti]MBU3008787.1 hypothetical protein [Cobetia amphilecti]